MPASTGVPVLPQIVAATVFQGETCLPPVSPGCSPSEQAGLTPNPSKLLPLCWDLECVRFCMHPVEAEFLFPVSPMCKPHWPSTQPDDPGSCLPHKKNPRLGSLMWTLDHLLLEENLCNHPPVCELLLWECGSCRSYRDISSPPTRLTTVLSLYL